MFYTFGLGIMITLIVTFYWINNYPDDYSLVFNVIYLTFSKTLFIIGLNMFLLPLLMGHGSTWQSILGADIFTPLARLTFGAYMFHPMLTHFFNNNQDRGYWGSI